MPSFIIQSNAGTIIFSIASVGLPARPIAGNPSPVAPDFMPIIEFIRFDNTVGSAESGFSGAGKSPW